VKKFSHNESPIAPKGRVYNATVHRHARDAATVGAQALKNPGRRASARQDTG
jgi:hypothetical protein